MSTFSLCSCSLQAQGILTLTPGRSTVTLAGTGSRGYSGDGGDAISAQLAHPSGIAYDTAGNLFIADANNHVLRQITPAGVISTVAGTGTAGFGGDNGPAEAAFLDTPTSVAVDLSGNLFIADSHNHRIRKVSQGIITTIAGTGTSGYSGDGGAATSAQLALPSGVALDSNGVLFIADTNNQRVRRVASGSITTVAGNGEQLFAGDGGPAIAASLDQPTGVAVDANGNLYIADKSNHRIRSVSAITGVISTLAGSGSGSLSGSFGGDGTLATSAALAKPVGISVDAAGNVYVADTNNQRIRQIGANGTITTVAGTGDQGYSGDGGPALSAVLNTPRAILTDTLGNLNVADTSNQRLRAVAQARLSFSSQPVGSTSTPQSVTLSNTGTAPLTISSLTFSGPFLSTAGASCTAVPITLSPGASCVQNVAFRPTSAGAATGSLSITGQGLGTQTVLLTGGGSITSTSLLLAANKPASLIGEPVLFTATLNLQNGPATGAGGSVTFYAGSTVLGSSSLVAGIATLSTAALPAGTQAVSAVYSGSAGFSAATATAISENVGDLSLAFNAATSLTIAPSHSVTVPLSLAAQGTSGLTGTIVLTTSPLPAGMSIVFAPSHVALGTGQLPVTMTVTAPPETSVAAALPLAGSAILLFLLLPSARRRTLMGFETPHRLALVFISLGGFTLLGMLTGCGGPNGFFAQKQQTYTVTVTATATDSSGATLARSTTVPITVQ